MSPIHSKFNSKVVDIVFASFKLKEEILDEEREGISWISLANYDLKTTVATIKEAVINQKTAKNILVAAFQKFLGNTDVQVLIKYLHEIYELVKDQDQNRLVFGTALFLPTQEEYWKLVALFNKECQILNERLNMPRVNLHRSVMRQMQDDTMEIKPQNWQEFQLGVATGRTLSHEGMEQLFRYIRKAFDTVFCDNALTLRSKPPKVICPPSLATMPEYKNNTFFRQVLEVKGIIPRRTQSSGYSRRERLSCTDDRLPGWRHWRIFKDQGPLWTLSSREGALEAHNFMLNRSDEKPVWEEDMEEVVDNKEQDREVEVIEEEEDSVFEDDVRLESKEICEKVEKKTEKKDLYESHDDSKTTTKLLKLARDKVRESEHMLTIANEKIKAYKKESATKEAQIVKEKAAVKHWRNMVDNKQSEIDKLTADLKKLEVSYERVLDRCEEVTQEYEYLCEAYGKELDKPKKPKVTRRYPKKDD